MSFNLFILDLSDFNLSKAKEYLRKNTSINVSQISDINSFSLFMRYFIFERFYNIENPVFNNEDKPHIINSSICFNISHSSEKIVMFAGDIDVGVDIETISKKRRYSTLAKRFFSDEEYKTLLASNNIELDFIILWTLKEAEVKRSGEGIAKGFKSAHFSKGINKSWKSEKYPNDFYTFSYDDMFVSVCCDNVIEKQINFFEIDDFEFKKLKLRG